MGIAIDALDAMRSCNSKAVLTALLHKLMRVALLQVSLPVFFTFCFKHVHARSALFGMMLCHAQSCGESKP